MLSSHPAMESECAKDTALAVPEPGWAAGDLRAPRAKQYVRVPKAEVRNRSPRGKSMT